MAPGARHALFAFAVVILGGACERAPSDSELVNIRAAARDASGARAPVARSVDTRVRVEPLPATDPPVFAAFGNAGPRRLVFLHGMCGHGLGYAQSFQFSAARRGRLIAPQGDLRCGAGPWAKWSADVEALEARIETSFTNLETAPGPALVMGYSQGATRAEQLARSHPERYAWLIAIGAPRAPSPQGLRHLQRAVMMAGERDRQDLMRAAARNFDRAGIPTIFLELPEASHGAMGREPERTMSEAFAWLFDETKARPAASGSH